MHAFEGGSLSVIDHGFFVVYLCTSPALFAFTLTLTSTLHFICHLGNVNNTEDIKDGQFQAESKDSQLTGELRDNRSLVDNNTAQSLTGEDIEDMRR